jgi:hypothetical protein
LAEPMRDALPAANRTTPKTLHVSLPSRFRKPAYSRREVDMRFPIGVSSTGM